MAPLKVADRLLSESHLIFRILIELSSMTEGYWKVTLTRTVGVLTASGSSDPGDVLPNQSCEISLGVMTSVPATSTFGGARGRRVTVG